LDYSCESEKVWNIIFSSSILLWYKVKVSSYKVKQKQF
jgi:hypothetical protein